MTIKSLHTSGDDAPPIEFGAVEILISKSSMWLLPASETQTQSHYKFPFLLLSANAEIISEHVILSLGRFNDFHFFHNRNTGTQSRDQR